MTSPNFELYPLDPVILGAYVREWIAGQQASGAFPKSGNVANSLQHAPLDEHARRLALFGRGAWVMLEEGGKPVRLTGMAACRYDDHHPGFLTLEYDGGGRVIRVGYWKRDEPGNWTRCEGDDLPKTLKQGS